MEILDLVLTFSQRAVTLCTVKSFRESNLKSYIGTG